MKRLPTITLTCLLATLVFAGNLFATDEILDFTQVENPEISPVFINRTAASEAPIESPDVFQGRLIPRNESFELRKQMTFAMEETVNDDGVVESVAPMAGKKNPGRAVMLSAIVPGAGQLYADSKWKALGFFALEVACWYGAIHYKQEGEDIEDKYEDFADGHWLEPRYLDYEYYLATEGSHLAQDEHFQEPRTDWDDLLWSEKLEYLPENFTHELPDTKTQQYYEMIGKYLTQFGIGWDDAPYTSNSTYQMSWWEQNRTTRAGNYIDMRYDSNQKLDASANFFMVITVNHVLSALEAGFTVVRHNRKLAEAELGARTINYDNQATVVAGLNFTF